MPTYDYECKECGSVVEVFQSITASALRKMKCEKCDAVRPVRRLIGTGGAVLFKGSGFYQTDYRSKGYQDASKSEKGDGGSDGKKAGDSTKASSSESVKGAESSSTPATKSEGKKASKEKS